MALQYAVAWAAVRAPLVTKVVKSRPQLLFYRGSFVEEALTRERVTEGEVYAAVRESGIGSLEQVEAVVLETAGELSVISKSQGASGVLVDVAKPGELHETEARRSHASLVTSER